VKYKPWQVFFFFFFTLVAGPRRSLILTLSDARVYEPQLRARLGTTAHFCRVVFLKLRAFPNWYSSQFRRGAQAMYKRGAPKPLNSEPWQVLHDGGFCSLSLSLSPNLCLSHYLSLTHSLSHSLSLSLSLLILSLSAGSARWPWRGSQSWASSATPSPSCSSPRSAVLYHEKSMDRLVSTTKNRWTA